MFIITHAERLSDCNDQEIFSMFLLAIQTIEQETRLSNARWKDIRFIGITLNHGNVRNIEHLHLKIRIDDNSKYLILFYEQMFVSQLLYDLICNNLDSRLYHGCTVIGPCDVLQT